ncbi:MAG: metal-dependent transcriptional regulator [Thermoprotei archaeon]|jgi:DtxR family Mn-dependent transcriptional regulator
MITLSQREAVYLRTIGELTMLGTKPTTSVKIAKALGVKAPSVIDMIKRFSEMGLVKHTPWKGIQLTEQGIHEVRMLIRNHRILETYLYQVLGINVKEACEGVSDFDLYVPSNIINNMCSYLGHPKKCPHGLDIPAAPECCGGVSN